MSGKPNNLVGNKYGRLTVLEVTNDRSKQGDVIWKCKCDCGKILYTTTRKLTSGNTKSCGCYSDELHKKRFIDLTGKKFGMLHVLSKKHKNKWGDTIWECECECGNIIEATGNRLKTKRKTSCGCVYKHPMQTHDKTFDKNGKRTTMYMRWNSMKQRCYNTKHQAYKNYGGRGIEICERWKNSFENFYNDMGEPPAKNLTIDRIDNDGNYEPSNCRWATWEKQRKNQRKAKRRSN